MIKWTYKQIKLFRWKYIFYIGCIIVYTLISLLTPIIGKYIIDILIPNKQLKMLVGISCVWLVVECFRNSINICLLYTSYTDAKLIAELSTDLGEAMVGINEQEIELLMAERGK